MKTAKMILSDSQIKNLPLTAAATPGLIIIPAQGVGRVILSTLYYLRLKWFANYTNIAAGWNLYFSASDNNTSFFQNTLYGTSINFVPIEITSLLANGGDGDAFGLALEPSSNSAVAGSAFGMMSANWYSGPVIANQGFSMFVTNAGAGALTGGDPRNKLLIQVDYRVIDISGLG